MRKHLFARVLALVLVLSLIPCWGVTAWADTTFEANGIEKTNPSSYNVSSSNDITAEAVYAHDGGTANIKGDATAVNDAPDPAKGGSALAVLVEETTGKESAANVEGNVSASTTSTNSSVADSATGVYVSSENSGSSAEAKIGGEISATATGTGKATGVIVSSGSSGSTAEAEIGGDVSATSTGAGSAFGVDVSSGHIEGQPSGTSTVKVNGDISATASGSGKAAGLTAIVELDGVVTVTTGDVEAETKGSDATDGSVATGIYVDADWSKVEITAGEVEAEAELSNRNSTKEDSVGIDVYADNGTVDITVDEVESEAGVGTAHGIDLDSRRGSNITVTVNGPMTVTGVEYAQGLEISAKSGSITTVTFNDDIEVETKSSGGNGMYIVVDDGEAYVTVNGDVSSGGSGIQVAGGSGLVDVEIDGSLEAATTGLAVNGNLDVDILVSESIQADGIGIQIGNGTTTDNLEVTVWQIDTNTINGEDHVAAEGGDHKITDASRKLEQNINYIIRIKPSQESIISLTGTTDKHGYNTAHMGDKVAMKVNVPSGYKLTGAYGDKGEKLALKMDSSGNYFVIVPMGGGVYLSAVLDRISDGIDYMTYVPNAGMATVTFDLNEGHTITGNPGPIIKCVPVGTWLRLLDKPLKDGSEFELWHTDDPSIKVSQPNESFCVMGDVTFTAKWVGEEIPYKMTEEETDLVTTLSDTAVIPVVEETTEEPAPVEEEVPADQAAAEELVPAAEAELVEKAGTGIAEATAAVKNAAAIAEEELKTTADELSAAKEELRATVEELNAAKEELRKTTEELNAAKEEFMALLAVLREQTAPAEEPEEEAAPEDETEAAAEAPADMTETEETETVPEAEAAPEEIPAAEELAEDSAETETAAS